MFNLGFHLSLRQRFFLVSFFLIILFSLSIFSQRIKDPQHSFDYLSFSKEELSLTMEGYNYNFLSKELSPLLLQEIEKLKKDSGNDLLIIIDRLTGKPSEIEGGIPWIPGKGLRNNIQPSDIGVTMEQAIKNEIPVEIVDSIAKEFLKKYPSLFNIDINDLVLEGSASGPMLDYLYYLNYKWTYNKIPVENAWLNFQLNNGNLVLFGSTYISDTIKKLDPAPSIKIEDAWNILLNYINEKLGSEDEILEPGKLIIQPVLSKAALNGQNYELGSGIEYRLVYVMVFKKNGVMGTWEGRVDAHTGELLSFKDINYYGHIQGGVYKTDKNPSQTEVKMPFPYANYSGTTSFADINGDFPGTTGTSTMVGRTGSSGNVGGVKISDNCGSISLASDANGLIDFGTSTGTDCTTPGYGGLGNTHSARTQYWNVSQIKIKAYTYLSGNTWLQGLLTDNVNLNQTCNAYWNGSTVNFFKSSTNCGNTGELPGVSLHEWGHGMDANDGNGSSPDYGTGESYGDTTAMLQTHQSCLGGGFWKAYNLGCGTPPSQGNSYHNCDGYGDCCVDCSGVRDVDYAKHSSGTPATLTFAKACPTSALYKGPCGREGHCESYVSSEANWDLATRDLVTWGLDQTTAWQLLDKFWYASAPNRTAAFVCTADASTGTGNYAQVYRVVDDCDGNLSNGTPHASAIWNALHRHQIGNSSAVNTDNNCGCANLATPNLSGTAGNASVTLTWSAISGASSYDIYRNETSCTAGFTKIGNTTSTSYTDSPLANGVTYYYRIQAKGSGSCPPSAMSNCVTLTPSGSGCTPPSAPTGLNITSNCNSVSLSWSAVSGASGYNIYRSTSTCTNPSYTKIGTTTSTTYTDSTASAGTTYAYVVRAYSGTDTCESGNSNCVSTTVQSSPTAPSAPTVTDDCTGLKVSWSASSGATSYNVYGRSGGCGNNGWSQVASGITTTNWTDTSAVLGSTYGYYIEAVNNCGTATNGKNACGSGTHNLTTPSAPTNLTATGTCTSIDLSWSSVSSATSYNILRTINSNCSTGLTQIGTSTTTSYSDTTAASGTTYYYVVQAVNECGSSPSSNCANSTKLSAPGQPVITNITDESACAQSGIRIYYNSGSGATSHSLYKDGTLAVSNYTSGALYNPGDTSSHSYFIRATNSCGNTDSASQNFTDANNTTIPTITGPSSNTCPSISVLLTTESGMSNYQWYLGGSPISGANSYQYIATVSGNYTVSYTNSSGCTGTSAPKTVTINPCIPNIIYQSNGTFTEITGNGDNYFDKGEKWSVQVTLTNNGTADATNVNATLSGNGIEVCQPTKNFGNIPVSGTGSATFEFVISETFTPCGGSIGFDITNKTSNEATPAGSDEYDVFSITVGSGGGGIQTLFGPDDSPATSGLWTGSISSQTVAHCSPSSDAYNRIANNSNTYLVNNVSTIGYTNIRVIFDAGLSSAGQTIYLDYSIDGGSNYTNIWSYTGSTNWQCAQQVTLPSSCENISTLKIRFRTGNVNASARAMMDNIQIIGDAGTLNCDYVGNGTCAVCTPPSQPTITNITDNDTCAQSGITLTFASGSPATRHDLYKDGSLAQSNVTSPIIYNPGDTNSHSYVVRAINGNDTCLTDSNPSSFADANNTPEAITLNAINYNSSCGIQINFTGGAGANQYDLYVDGFLAQTNITSGYIYLPSDTNSHNYVVRGINGTCFKNSNTSSAFDSDCTVPSEITNIVFSGQVLSWQADPSATGYRVYRGIMENLPALCNATQDFCIRYDGASNSLDISGDNPSSIDPVNKVLFYLITGYNNIGEGTVGNATCGARQVNMPGNCP